MWTAILEIPINFFLPSTFLVDAMLGYSRKLGE